MIASVIFLYPKLALRALLELFAFDEVHKLLIILAHCVRNLILFAAHILMPLNSAVQAILFVALQAFESLRIAFLMEEHVAAIGSRAPRDGISMLISISFQCMLLVLIEKFIWENVPQVSF